VTVGQVSAAAGEYLRKHVQPAVPVVQPGQHSLVNFPNIVSTADAGPQTFAITVPLPGTVTATPTYRWRFTGPDQTITTAEGTGRTYDGTSPRTGPADYYLTATFRRHGTGHIELTATWTGTATVQNNPPVPLDPLALTTATDLQVEQLRPVLLDPR